MNQLHLPTHNRRRTLALQLIGWFSLAAVPLSLTGCDDAYSADMRYGVRTDPIVKDKLKEGNIENIVDPDPPGQFPILSVKDFLDPRNPYFAANTKLLKEDKNLVKAGNFIDPNLLSDKDRQDLNAALDKLFGTPAHPTVANLSESVQKELQLSDRQLEMGSMHYRQHCLHCHGKTGDGRGPTARWVNPHPRDYRNGWFKFESVDQTEISQPPSRDDLMRIVENGIEGTAMPSFALRPKEERQAIVSYVIHLSMRGFVEIRTFKEQFEYDASKNALNLVEDRRGRTLEEIMTKYHSQNVNLWAGAQSESAKIKVAPYPFNENDADYPAKLKESVDRGHDLFKSTCANCHRDYGRQSLFRYDDWGTYTRPNNLPQGVMRGGRRPVDIYYRIHSGILPSGMLAYGQKAGPFGGANASKIWDLVNFVQVIGNPTMRKSLGTNID